MPVRDVLYWLEQAAEHQREKAERQANILTRRPG
jgi:hypothetical protein